MFSDSFAKAQMQRDLSEPPEFWRDDTANDLLASEIRAEVLRQINKNLSIQANLLAEQIDESVIALIGTSSFGNHCVSILERSAKKLAESIVDTAFSPYQRRQIFPIEVFVKNELERKI